MIKKGFLLTAVVLLSMAAFVQAGPFESTRDDIGVSIGNTYLTRYIWYGFDIFPDNHSAMQPFANFDLWGTGWLFDVRLTRANSGGFENWEQIDYTLSYGATANPDTSCAMDWRVGWRYYNHPDGPVRMAGNSVAKWDIDRQELFATFAWPEICSSGFVPSYTVVYVTPEEGGKRSSNPSALNGNSLWREGAGFLHIVGLAKEVTLPCAPEQTIRLSADAVYNDGMGGPGVDQDWSHVNWGVQTDIAVNDKTTITPGIVYQTTMDKSVNRSDEWWAFVSLTFLCN
jgi:hypothetical protein